MNKMKYIRSFEYFPFGFKEENREGVEEKSYQLENETKVFEQKPVRTSEREKSG